MTATSVYHGEPVLRPERDRNPSLFLPSTGKSPEMEDTMFEAMMKLGGYRVDYMNRESAGKPAALGLYVMGDLPAHQSYSRIAKHNLFTGLVLIREQQEEHNLVAVYLDVNSPFESHRPAYQQMKRDIKAGMFRRLLVPSVRDLSGDEDMSADFWSFYRTLERIEILSSESGFIAPVSFHQIVTSSMVSAV